MEREPGTVKGLEEGQSVWCTKCMGQGGYDEAAEEGGANKRGLCRHSQDLEKVTRAFQQGPT